LIGGTKIRWAYLAAGLYILANAIAIWQEAYWFAVFPLLAVVIWSVFFRLDQVLLFIVLCTPISLNLENLEIGGIGFYLPTEPLLFGVLVVFLIKFIRGESINRKIYTHPISVLLYVYLAWMGLTTITSELPIVSIKFMIAKLWFIVPLYFMMAHIFQDVKNVRRFQLLYIFPLIAVVIYTVARHSGYGFEKDAGHWVMEPFYKDHTSYGAVLAMYIPVALGLLIRKKLTPLMRTLIFTASAILIIGVVLSFTRAAWVSLLAAAVLMGFMFLRIKLHILLASVILVGGFVWTMQDDLLIMLEKNTQDSSDNLAEHVESISNVSSDASNLERLNRWYCAFEMFNERPIVGWGPGTYQFVYAPFQRSTNNTIISTNNADGGNAHSEYFGPLSEQGLAGALIMLALVFAVFRLSFKLFYELKDREMRILVLTSFLGLVTYFIHGILNNYLDTDKASVPFWGFIAILVAVDLFHRETISDPEETAMLTTHESD
jgi:putative inorganic carbon (hco3(-)) transporter